MQVAQGLSNARAKCKRALEKFRHYATYSNYSHSHKCRFEHLGIGADCSVGPTRQDPSTASAPRIGICLNFDDAGKCPVGSIYPRLCLAESCRLHPHTSSYSGNAGWLGSCVLGQPHRVVMRNIPAQGFHHRFLHGRIRFR